MQGGGCNVNSIGGLLISTVSPQNMHDANDAHHHYKHDEPRKFANHGKSTVSVWSLSGVCRADAIRSRSNACSARIFSSLNAWID
jgi:sugar (pentulose or hexulose) kinase